MSYSSRAPPASSSSSSDYNHHSHQRHNQYQFIPPNQQQRLLQASTSQSHSQFPSLCHSSPHPPSSWYPTPNDYYYHGTPHQALPHYNPNPPSYSNSLSMVKSENDPNYHYHHYHSKDNFTSSTPTNHNHHDTATTAATATATTTTTTTTTNGNNDINMNNRIIIKEINDTNGAIVQCNTASTIADSDTINAALALLTAKNEDVSNDHLFQNDVSHNPQQQQHQVKYDHHDHHHNNRDREKQQQQELANQYTVKVEPKDLPQLPLPPLNPLSSSCYSDSNQQGLHQGEEHYNFNCRSSSPSFLSSSHPCSTSIGSTATATTASSSDSNSSNCNSSSNSNNSTPNSLSIGQEKVVLKSSLSPPLPLLPLLSSFTGSISLTLPDDEDMLSPLHCFMRKHCIEAFTISSQDERYHQPNATTVKKTASSNSSSSSNDTSKSNTNGISLCVRKKIKFDIVGIRCIFCKHCPHEQRADRSVTYPSSVNNIYYSMETWQRRHAPICKSIPQWAKREMVKLAKSSKGIGGGRRRYWAESAEALGMIDTDKGIRFKKMKNPQLHIDRSLDPNANYHNEPVENAKCSGFDSTDDDGNGIPREQHSHELNKLSDCTSKSPFCSPSYTSSSRIQLVTNRDRSIVTEYLFLLVSQMERCEFTEDDRTGGRSKVKTNKIGFPGIQCKHCCGKAGYGRYFPTSISSLNLANSDRNMYNHLMKCRKCPAEVRDKLKKLRLSKFNGGQKIERGGRKDFFKRVWERLHDGKSIDTATRPTTSTATTTSAPATTKAPATTVTMKHEYDQLDAPSLLPSGSISSTLGQEDKVQFMVQL